ncbi:uncharacterized protein LOC119176215 [Rhipicephalus microplus]|uniref:uncharacterized protein LOC119176215 n=1 Tax=Rhipicephalus microplus TaxID=6941 RepID=UPI003F6C96B6
MDHADIDLTFSCPVCLEPRQSMVFGRCQHFVCASCLYEPVSGCLKAAFHCCPLCLAEKAFPDSCPEIRETTKRMMKLVGVVQCPRKRCGEEMWIWDQEEHEKSCQGVVTRSSSRRCGLPESASTSRGVTTRQSKQRRCKSSAPVDN